MSLLTREELYSAYQTLDEAVKAIEEAEAYAGLTKEMADTLSPIKARVTLEKALASLGRVFD